MSKNYKKINFTLDSELIESIMRFLPEDMDFSNFVKCCFINRCIDKGYLNEFGMPVEFPVPKLDFDNINTFPNFDFLAHSDKSFNLNDIREIASSKDK